MHEVHIYGFGAHVTPHLSSWAWQQRTSNPALPPLLRVAARRPDLPQGRCELVIVPRGATLAALPSDAARLKLGDCDAALLFGRAITDAAAAAQPCGFSTEWRLRTRGHQMRWPSSFFLFVDTVRGRGQFLFELSGPFEDPSSLSSVLARPPAGSARIVVMGPFARDPTALDGMLSGDAPVQRARTGAVDWIEQEVSIAGKPQARRSYLLLGKSDTQFVLVGQAPRSVFSAAAAACDDMALSFVAE